MAAADGGGRASWRGWAAVALGAAVLLWPALLNGRPSAFFDTAYYWSEGRFLAESLNLSRPPPGADPTRLDDPARPDRPTAASTIAGARAPAFSAFVFGTEAVGGLWLSIVLQALTAAWLVWRSCRAFLARSGRGFAVALGALALVSTLPFFAGFVMPDVWAGFLVVAAGLLVWAPQPPGRWEAAGLAAVVAFGAAGHSATLALGLWLWICAAGLAAWAPEGMRPGRRALVLFGAALLLGAAASPLLRAPMERRLHASLGKPPFLTARLLADGPGRRRLEAVCIGPDRPYAVCRARAVAFRSSEDVLWAEAPSRGVFTPSPYAVRREMERQDLPFALDVVTHDPGGVLASALRNGLLQSVLVFADDPLTNLRILAVDPFWRRTPLPHLIPGAGACAEGRGCASRTPAIATIEAEMIGFVLALGIVLRALLRRAAWAREAGAPRRTERLRLFCAWGLAAVLANALICGALSGPFPRYQARVAWVVVLSAALLVEAGELPVARPRRRAA